MALPWPITTRARANTTRWGTAAASTAPPARAHRPTHRAVRRARRSTTMPLSGVASPPSSLMAMATPIRSSDTPTPTAMVARKGGAKRNTALAVVRAAVSRPSRARTSAP